MSEGNEVAEPREASSVARPREVTRRPYERPRIERRIPVAANTLQPTSGSQDLFGPGEE